MPPQTPLQTPQSSTPPLHNKFKAPALVLGIASLATCWVPLLGLVLGITALILTAKANKESKRLGQTPPEKLIPQRILSISGTVLGGIFLVVSLIAFIVALVGIGGSIFNSAQGTSKYSDKVEAFEEARRDFGVGETVKYGPYTINMNAQQEYMPSPEELALIRSASLRAYNSPEEFGSDIPEGSLRYAKVTARISAEEQYRGLSTVQGWADSLEYALLNGYYCALDDAQRDMLDSLDRKMVHSDTPIPSATVSYVCIYDAAHVRAVLGWDVSVFTRVSAIVGTEGMPTKEYHFEAQVW